MAKADDLAVGPGAVAPVDSNAKPMLEGLDENYYVEILNPLSNMFKGKVASSRPQNMPLRIVGNDNTPTITRTEDDIRRNYGLDLRNSDHKSLNHITQVIEIPPGGTVRLPGNEAQVVIRQLVNIIMSVEGNKHLMGDPYQRRLVEERVIQRQGTMSEFYNLQSVDMTKVIQDKKHEEESFPGEDQFTGTAGGADSADAGDAAESAAGTKRGRPAKAAA